jgi:hypothetical protein
MRRPTELEAVCDVDAEANFCPLGCVSPPLPLQLDAGNKPVGETMQRPKPVRVYRPGNDKQADGSDNDDESVARISPAQPVDIIVAVFPQPIDRNRSRQ